MDDLRKNGLGYYDETAYKAMQNVISEEDFYKRCRETLKEIFKICESNGLHLENRVELKDFKTGKIWR